MAVLGYEKIIVTGEIFEGSASSKKFVPLIRGGLPKESCLLISNRNYLSISAMILILIQV